MKNKILKTLAMTGLIGSVMVGCGSSVAELTLSNTVEVATATIEDIDAMQEITAPDLEAYYGITAVQYVQFSGKVSGIGTSAAEIVIIEAVDSATASDIEEKAKTRLEDKLRQAEGYLPEEYDIVKQGVVRKDGNYVALFVTGNMDEVIAAYETELAQ